MKGFRYGLAAAFDLSLLVVLTAFEQVAVEFVQVGELRHRRPPTPPEPPYFLFHAALSVAPRGRAEIRREQVVRTKRNEPRGLLAPLSSHDVLNGTFEIVITQRLKRSAEHREGARVSIQKRLLCRSHISPMKRRAAIHAPQAEHLQLHSFTAQIGVGFVPVHLRFPARFVLLADIGFRPFLAALLLPFLDRTPNATRTHWLLRHLFPQPLIDALRRMALLAGRLLIFQQDPMDEQQHGVHQPGCLTFYLFAFCWNGTSDGFSYRPPVYAYFLGHT